MTFLLVPIAEATIDPIVGTDARTLPPSEVVRIAERILGVLDNALSVRIDGEALSIALPDDFTPDESAAQRLLNQGVESASKGNYTPAIKSFRKSIEANPLQSSAPRNLAMALLESGGSIDEAESLLRAVILLAPRDAEAYILLGNIYATKKNDSATGLRLYQRAVEIDPNNAVALTNNAGLLGKRGEYDKAESLFNRATQVSPAYANAYYGLAYLCKESGRTERGLLALDDMWRNATLDGIRNAGLLKFARSLYAELSEMATQKNADMIRSFLEERKRALEQATGYPIDIADDPNLRTATSITRMAWRYSLTRHEIRHKAGIAPPMLPHILAHEIEHIQLEHEARQVRRNVTFKSTREAYEKATQTSGAFIDYLRRNGIAGDASNTIMRQMVDGLCAQLLNCPLDMCIESRLFERYDVLRPFQFVSLRQQNLENQKVLFDKEVASASPRAIFRASLSMNAAFALFTDTLYGGKTNYAEPYRKTDVWAAAEKLHSMFQAMYPPMSPGDEYELVKKFSHELGLDGWWTMTDANPDAESEGGVTNPELLEEKKPAIIMYFVGILGRFAEMTDEQIKDIGFEVALLGQHGLDYSNDHKRYSLRTMPGEQFTGLYLTCLMYAAFQRINPSLDTGLEYAMAFAEAQRLFAKQ